MVFDFLFITDFAEMMQLLADAYKELVRTNNIQLNKCRISNKPSPCKSQITCISGSYFCKNAEPAWTTEIVSTRWRIGKRVTTRNEVPTTRCQRCGCCRIPFAVLEKLPYTPCWYTLAVHVHFARRLTHHRIPIVPCAIKVDYTAI